uniref:Uncharacterized protein n=1 Tax=Tanacetum cinerariifolium TaxID=118510 RepID=A0A6L2LYR2_TANCI|nr:hypothetical protein [Tanacetum cinerariifolium]
MPSSSSTPAQPPHHHHITTYAIPSSSPPSLPRTTTISQPPPKGAFGLSEALKERQLHKKTLHEKDSNYDLSVIKVQFHQFIHSKVLEPSNYNSYDLETRRDFKDYTQMEPQTFKEEIIKNMDSIEQCIVKRAHHERELQNRLKRLNERKLQIQQCKIQKVKASYASSGETDCSRIVSDKGNDQGLENQSNTSEDENTRSRNMLVEKVDSNVISDSPDMCDNEIQTDQNVVECDDEQLVDQAWEKHSHASFCAPTALDMEVLIQTCLMPLAIKTQNDSFTFVHELKETAFATNQKSTGVTPHSWPQVRKLSFAMPYNVNAPDPSRNSLKHVSFQSPRESVGSNDMVHNYYLEEAKKKA